MNTTQTIDKPFPVTIEKPLEIVPEAEICLGGVPVGDEENKKGLKFSLWDGVFSNAMLALMETFSIAAAVFLHAPALAISLLGSLPLLLSSVGQFLLPRLIDPSRGRKHYVLRGTLSQSIFLLLLALSGWLPSQSRPWAYVLLFSLYGFCGNVVSGLWIAWMGDLVPSSVRGRHFAWRNRFFSTTQLCCAIGAGFISRKYTTENAPWSFFAGVFIAAAFFRFISSYMLSRQYEPKITADLPDRAIATTINDKIFKFYSISAALMLGTVAISGPFFNVWYVRDLKFDYFTLAFASAATILGTIISLPFWGKLADSIGNRKVILWTGFLIATVPIPYIFSNHSWQIWVLNFYTGVCWSGYNLSNFNYLLTAAGKSKPEHKISLSVAMAGISVFFFSLAGGFLSTRLPELFGWQLKSLFLLSAILRFAVYGTLFVHFPVIEKENTSSIEIFHQIPGYRVGMGILRNAFRAFRRT